MLLPFLLLALEQPSVLVIMADDLGMPERPLLSSIDALAAQGLEFTRAYGQATCSIARIEAMFGRYHRREGIGDLSLNAHIQSQDRLPVGLVSIAELLRPTHATALIGKWHLGRARLFGEMDSVTSGPWVQGWEAWASGCPSALDATSTTSGYYNWPRVSQGDLEISTVYATDAQLDSFIAWWTGTTGPKLAWLAWSAPHSPFDPPPGHLPAPTTREAYEQVIAYLDGAIESALQHVDLSNTFVIFTADNGTPDEARPVGTPTGVWKGSVREGGIHVPLVIAGPGIVPSISNQLVSLVDIGATVADLLHVQITRGFEDSLSCFGPPRSFVFSERYKVSKTGVSLPQAVGYDGQAVIESAWKLIHEDADGDGPSGFADLFFHMPEELPLKPSFSIQARLLAELASIPPRAP